MQRRQLIFLIFHPAAGFLGVDLYIYESDWAGILFDLPGNEQRLKLTLTVFCFVLFFFVSGLMNTFLYRTDFILLKGKMHFCLAIQNPST